MICETFPTFFSTSDRNTGYGNPQCPLMRASKAARRAACERLFAVIDADRNGVLTGYGLTVLYCMNFKENPAEVSAMQVQAAVEDLPGFDDATQSLSQHAFCQLFLEGNEVQHPISGDDDPMMMMMMMMMMMIVDNENTEIVGFVGIARCF